MTLEHTLRDHLRACLRAGLAAVEPQGLVRAALEKIRASDSPLFPPNGASPGLLVAAFGKAAMGMARGAREVFGDRIVDGIVVVPSGTQDEPPQGFRIRHGLHPFPDETSVAAAEAVREVVEEASRRGLPLLGLISGGASALLTLPAEGVSLEAVRSVTRSLQASGATIGDLNCVRKHLDQLKGGRLAHLASPAPVTGLVLSDVVGDPLDVIASGPLSPDPTTFAAAVEVLRRHALWADAPPAVRAHLEAGVAGRIEESPAPGDPCFARVTLRIVGSARTAREAARTKAEGLGYEAHVQSDCFTGEAREIGRRLGLDLRARSEARPVAFVRAGESTVTVRGKGVGGRNQELVLAAAIEIDALEGAAIASIGTDGIDGPTDVAGALATGETIGRARALGLDPHVLLEDNDSYRLFDTLGDHIRTGRTGTNVMDLIVAVRRPTATRP